MNTLKDLIKRCHQRREKQLKQRRTVVTSAPYKGLSYHFTVYCAHKYPVKLYELEESDISFMPIGHAPWNDNGPRDSGGERFLRRQGIEDWLIRHWHKSCGIQVYTGIPSESNGARWHDFNFTYKALCAAPDAVLACIETLTTAVANPLLTMTKSGGIRFSCRIPDYLHPKTEESKQYIYKHTPTTENSYHRDVYLEISGEEGYNRWDARYEILLGNLLDPPIIAKEVLFTVIDALRAELHDPTSFGEERPKSTPKSVPVVSLSLGSHNLDLAKLAFTKRGFSYVQQENDFHYWLPAGSKDDNTQVSLWERDGTVWVGASTSDAGLPMEPTSITDVWDDTGILPPTPTAGFPVSETVLAVREGKLSPLAIKRPSPVLQKLEHTAKVYETLEKTAVQIQRAFDGTARIAGLLAEKGAGKSYAVESYVLNNNVISLSTGFWTAEETAQHFQKRNLPSVARWRNRMYLWKHVKDIPVEVRMATPFQRGNVCEDPERCNTLEEKGGDPSESICPKCPVYAECQEHGYLSQSAALQRAKVQLTGMSQLFLNPRHGGRVAEILGQTDEIERLCIIDEIEAHNLFFECRVRKDVLEEWSATWQGSALGNFAKALLNVLETKGQPYGNAVRRIRTTLQAFEQYKEELITQMCQVNVRGKVVARGFVDAETGKELAHFTIEFEGGTSAYIPLDDNAADGLRTKGLPFFSLDSFVLNAETRVSMQMSQAIELGILDTSTVENIQRFPTVYSNRNWTFWHHLKHFFAYYEWDADAPMMWHNKVLRFWVPPVLPSDVKRLLIMSSNLSEQDLRRTFPSEDIVVTRVKPTAWVAGNTVFQIRTGTYPPDTLLEHYSDWNVVGISKTSQRFFSSILTEIERDSNVKHAIITYTPLTKHLTNVAEKENVCFVRDFKELEKLEAAFEETHVVWVVGTPTWEPGIIWRRTQILFGNDEKPLRYETETDPRRYKDERVQSVYEQNVIAILKGIIGRMGLNRLPNKKVVLVTSMELPDITDRSETLLFDWEDFEVAGGLDKLPEVIARRQRFEMERDNLTAESSRKEVERVLGCSARQANRVLQKIRGGNIPRVLFRDQIYSLLSTGEKTTGELVASIKGHPTSVRNELKRLTDAGEIVKVRWGVYSLPSETKH